jgi:subtilisin family serine protease
MRRAVAPGRAAPLASWRPAPHGRASRLDPRAGVGSPLRLLAVPRGIDQRFWAAEVLKLAAAQAAIGPTPQTIPVAVVDCGVDHRHPALAHKVLVKEAYHFIEPDVGPGAPDEDTHGTYLAGLIAGEEKDELLGACPQARIVPVKFFNNVTPGVPRDAARAIRYAVDHGAVVIDCSFDFFQDWGELEAAIAYAGKHDVLVVAAAGNSGDDNDLPGAVAPVPARYAKTHDNVMAVASSFLAAEPDGTLFEGLSDFSNYGKTSVQVAAPGGNHGKVTLPDGETEIHARLGVWGPSTMNNYVVRYGTSPAAAFAAGVAALVKLRWPDLAPADMIAHLIRTSDPIAGLKDKCVANGRLNALAAVTTLPKSGRGKRGPKPVGGGRPAVQPVWLRGRAAELRT